MDEYDRYYLQSLNQAVSSLLICMIAANLSNQLTPVVIIAATVFWTKSGQNLSVAEAFTILSIVALVSNPMVNIIAAYPTLIGALACLGRIQDFMFCTKRND